jgi:hypothetical protein
MNATKTKRDTLFDRLLATEASFLIYGATLPLAAMMARTRECTGGAKVIDLRKKRSDELPAMGDGATVIVLLGAEAEPAEQAAVLELLEAGRVIAFCGGSSTAPEIALAFGTAMASGPALRRRAEEVG